MIRSARKVVLAVFVAALSGCAQPPAPRANDNAPSDAGAAALQHPNAPGYGDVMAQVGRRFELVGRAATAGRFELAEFEAGELDELFGDVLPLAAPPKVAAGVDLRGVADAFRQTNASELVHAAKSRDRAALEGAFARAAGTCNGCHEATGHAFIEIPTRPGASVPRLDPLPAASGHP
jgi:hypothetical protein